MDIVRIDMVDWPTHSFLLTYRTLILLLLLLLLHHPQQAIAITRLLPNSASVFSISLSPHSEIALPSSSSRLGVFSWLTLLAGSAGG